MKKIALICVLAVSLCGIGFSAPKSKFASKLKNFGEKLSNAYVLPASYETAYSYRTNAPYKEIVALLKNKELEALRMSNPLKYVQQACEKITALAKNDFEK
ncbi:MAG: hypothetical protein J5700_00935, partial [Treponema sp.]|nr:hypothetical protein [Treponema sp.]